MLSYLALHVLFAGFALCLKKRKQVSFCRYPRQEPAHLHECAGSHQGRRLHLASVNTPTKIKGMDAGLEQTCASSDLVYKLEADLKPIPNKFFVAAQGNSIRTILKYFEDTAGDVIPGLKIPVATPLVYELEADLKPIPNKFSSRLMAIPSVPS